MKKIFLMLLLSITTFSTCSFFGESSGIIISPSEGQLINGIFNIIIKRPDDVVVDTLTLTLGTDTPLLYTEFDFDSGGYFYHEWQTSFLTNGSYVVSAVIIDQLYADTYSNSITVSVQN